MSKVPLDTEPFRPGDAGAELDLGRMRRARFQRLCDALVAADLPAAVLLGTSALEYATGFPTRSVDASHATHHRTVGLVVCGQSAPVLFTPVPELAAEAAPEASVQGPLDLDTEPGARAFLGLLADLGVHGSRVGFDQMTAALFAMAGATHAADAGPALATAKLCKTPDELECIQRAQRINEVAAATTRKVLRAGVRQTELSAVFLSTILELGATGNAVDPIWQPMPATRSAVAWTVHDDVAFPLVTTDRILARGEVVWVDTGITYHGYASDFGATWTVGTPPSSRTRAQERRWHDIVDHVLAEVRPGATGADLAAAARAAAGNDRPWLEHFYLVHGIGTDSAEMPLVGTDLGPEFDASLVLAPGMVLVLEPVIWEEGSGGYRAEQVVAVTEDGWTALGCYPQAADG